MIRKEELMIGDLILADKGYKTEKAVKVYSILNSEEYGGVMIEGECGLFSCLNFDPIPVTVDFLKKNGFEGYELQNGYYILRNAKTDEFDNVWDLIVICDETTGMVEVRVSLGEDAVDYSFPDFKYIHELQRCLRCCGLYDLANTLKV